MAKRELGRAADCNTGEHLIEEAGPQICRLKLKVTFCVLVLFSKYS